MRFTSVALLLAVPLVAFAQTTPAEAEKQMKLPPGFTARVVAHEPMVRQPVSMSFDERGRMWVLQYLQYPNPNGLKPVKQDQYLRTIWDKVPEPPPKGPKGLDRLTICFDPDEKGVFRKSKDFIAGLNLASGFCIGGGGVYVLQSPYLLFYPDKNHDDVPDGDPVVALSGFGFDDTHSVANSLQWGPDGWLYGAAGSTSTCKIPNPAKPGEIVEFQQGIWRYHPKSKAFELFSEGGGNTFGLDFDKHGQVIAGTNWGGFAMLHQMQGAYHVKGFSKHGPLHNPHTYGYFEHVPYKDFKGGHVTCGGIVYQGDTFPTEMRDQYIAGNLLSSAIHWHKITRRGSTFANSHGGELMTTPDHWFRPIDLMLGPDGSVYVVDWYDKRAAHLDPIDNWDKTNGRIYKIEYAGTPDYPKFDLRTKTAAELVELLKHPNAWWRREARRLLVERNDPKSQKFLEQVPADSGVPFLEALWTQVQLGWLEKGDYVKLLEHKDPHVRSWAVRLIVDGGYQIDLAHLANEEVSQFVIAQLACSAKRLPADKAWPILQHLICFDSNADDPYIPMLTWWAIEHHMTKSETVPTEPFQWCSAMMTKHLLERIVQRLTHFPNGFETIAKLLRQVPEADDWRRIVVKGLNSGVAGRKFDQPPKALVEPLEAMLQKSGNDAEIQKLVVRLGHASTAKKLLSDFLEKGSLSALLILTDVRHPDLPAALVKVFATTNDAKLRQSILVSMASYSDPIIDEILLKSVASWSPTDRAAARRVLFSRPATAMKYLELIDAKKLPAAEVPLTELRPLLAFNDKPLSAIIEKHYGKIGPATPGEKQARITWVGVILNKGKGDAKAGQALFKQHCATCHQFHGEGIKIGPDLTTADRKNTPYMVANIVDPSSYIRTEYVQHEANLLDGRKVIGIVTESTAKTVTLVDAQNKKTTVSREDLEDLKPSAVSMMPEKQLDTLTDQQICDLFAYLRSDPPKK
jgi:putative membrane-bound dehydrogenase-like protein